MQQNYIDNRTGTSYTLQVDYYLPDLILPAEEQNKPIGVWGSSTNAICKSIKEQHTSLCSQAESWTAILPILTGRRRKCFFG